MTFKRSLLVLGCALGMFAHTSCQDDKRNEADEVDLDNFDNEVVEEEGIEPDAVEVEDTSVVGAIQDNEELSTFSEGLARAELDDDFRNSEGPYTIFAPSNIAYDELSQKERNQFENVENINETGAGMHYLVVRGEHTAAELRQEIMNSNDAIQLQSLQGETLTLLLKDGEIFLTDAAGDSARITKSDIDAANGIVHIIDRVLKPKDLTRNDVVPKEWNERNDQLDLEQNDDEREPEVNPAG